MKGTDKFLIGIVLGIVVLIVAAFTITLTRPAASYKPDDTAENVAYNYLLAIHQSDYGRAQGYLSRTVKSRPSSAEKFARDVENNRYSFNESDSSAWAIDSSRVSGETTTVTVRQTRYSTGLFGSTYDDTFPIRLQREDGAWKIISSGSYWAYCWDNSRGCSD